MVALVYDPFPPDDIRKFIEEQVSGHTMVMTGESDFQPVCFFLRDAPGATVGGCLGSVWASYLHIRYLWVSPYLRGAGHGRHLLEAAEQRARDLGARASTLDTFNPAAKAFYLRLGYAVIGELPDWPPGFSRFYLRKPLVAA